MGISGSLFQAGGRASVKAIWSEGRARGQDEARSHRPLRTWAFALSVLGALGSFGDLIHGE